MTRMIEHQTAKIPSSYFLVAAIGVMGVSVGAEMAGRVRLSRLVGMWAERPDVILLDWMMPDLDGPGACERLKADPATRDIPVIFLTARSQKSDVERGVALGAVGHIAKPFNALALGAEVRRLLEGR